MLLYGPRNLCQKTAETCCTESASISVQRYSHLLYGLPRNSCQIKQPLCCLEICAETAVRPLGNCAKRLLYGLLENRAKICLGMCAKLCCTNLLNCCLGMCAKLLSPSPHCPEISLALLLSFSQSAHERMNDLFLL